MTQKVIRYPNMAPSFLLLHVITNEKTLKLKQVDWFLALPRFPPQKHVTTLVGIPVVTYTLVTTTLLTVGNGNVLHTLKSGPGTHSLAPIVILANQNVPVLMTLTRRACCLCPLWAVVPISSVVPMHSSICLSYSPPRYIYSGEVDASSTQKLTHDDII